MLPPPTKPIPKRLKPLREAYEGTPGLADELADLLDWTPEEVHDLLHGEVEPEPEDMVLIDAVVARTCTGDGAECDSQAAA